MRGQERWDYATYFGGAGDDFSNSVAVDAAGNTYVAGQTSSFGFPFAPGASPGYYSSTFDSFLVKLTPEGSLVFAKTIASGRVNRMWVDSEGNTYLAGQSTRQGFATTPGGFQPETVPGQAFAMKVAPDGQTIFSTYLGGNGSSPGTLAVDASRNVIVCGTARPAFIPLTENALQKPGSATQSQAGFCSQLSADGSRLRFATLLGGSGPTTLSASAIDAEGKLVVTGWTLSTDFPMKNAYQDADRRKTLFRLNRGEQGWTAVGDSSLGTVQSIQFLPNSDRMLIASGLGMLTGDLDGKNLQSLPGFGQTVAVHPRNGRYICASTTARQLRCSTDGGQSWSFMNFFGFNQVIADPKIEGGFYLATDQGLQYLRLDGGRGPNLSFPAGPARRMAIDASGEKTVIWVGGLAGFYRSLDGGERFDRLDGAFSLFEAAPSAPSVLYAVRSIRAKGQPLFARSDDAGSTWKDIGVGFEPSFIRAIAIDPQSFSQVYVASSEGVFRSEDGGETWKFLNAGLTGGALTLQFDSAGNLWAGAPLPEHGFVMKLNIDQPALEFSTLINGSGAAPLLTLDRNDGRTVILGTTGSSDFPVTVEDRLGGNPYYQMFMTVFDSSGQLESSRLLGTPGVAFALDPLGRLHVVGSGTAAETFGSDVRVNGAFHGGSTDGLWKTIDLDSGKLIQATWIGGSGADSFTRIAIGNDGKVRLVGTTTSTDFPVTSGALQPASGGQTDSFLVITQLPPQ